LPRKEVLVSKSTEISNSTRTREQAVRPPGGVPDRLQGPRRSDRLSHAVRPPGPSQISLVPNLAINTTDFGMVLLNTEIR
jgi:hypothetical protein